MPPSVCKKLENVSIFLAQHQLYNTSGYEVNYGKCDITVLSNRSGVLETVASFGCVAGHDYHGDKHISFVSEVNMISSTSPPGIFFTWGEVHSVVSDLVCPTADRWHTRRSISG